MKKPHPALIEFAHLVSSVKPSDLFSGDIDKRVGEIVLAGKREDDLNGAVRRRMISSINRWFWENPRDADDTRLVYKAEEIGSEYKEKKDGGARLVLKIRVELAMQPPEVCCC